MNIASLPNYFWIIFWGIVGAGIGMAEVFSRTKYTSVNNAELAEIFLITLAVAYGAYLLPKAIVYGMKICCGREDLHLINALIGGIAIRALFFAFPHSPNGVPGEPNLEALFVALYVAAAFFITLIYSIIHAKVSANKTVATSGRTALVCLAALLLLIFIYSVKSRLLTAPDGDGGANTTPDYQLDSSNQPAKRADSVSPQKPAYTAKAASPEYVEEDITSILKSIVPSYVQITPIVTTDSNIVGPQSFLITDSRSGAQLGTLHAGPIAVGSLGTQVRVLQTRVKNGIRISLYAESAGPSGALSKAIGWTSNDAAAESRAYIFLSPARIPDDLADLPERIFAEINPTL